MHLKKKDDILNYIKTNTHVDFAFHLSLTPHPQ